MPPPPARILVVKLATLGDLLTITPALRALRTSFPKAFIGVLTTAIGAAALRGIDSYDEIITFDKYAFDRPLEALAQLPVALDLMRELRRGSWDTLLLLHHLTTSFGVAKYAALSLGSGARRRIGLDNGRGGWFLTSAAEDRGFGWKHEVDYCLSVVEVLGARASEAPRLELCVSADDVVWAKSNLPPGVKGGSGSEISTRVRRGFGPENPPGVNSGFGPENPPGVNSGFGPENPPGVNSGFGPENPPWVNSGFGPENPPGVNGGSGSDITTRVNGGSGSENLPSGVALLVPGSGAYSTARRWAPERFAAVGQGLWRRHGLVPAVLSGLGQDEQALARELAQRIGPAAHIVPPAPSPQALGALVRTCDLVIANDSGVVHVASAVGTPVVAIFGPSNDRAWGPYPPGEARNQVVREQLACAPCIHRGHRFGTPQGCPARTCLALVEPDHVLAAAERALGATPVRQAVAV
jgi:ADP-heptose:LPS heptosyltransferase